MDDLSICKRIAGIEGWDYKGDGLSVLNDKVVINVTEEEEYNPLTDDALCFRLMVKYNIEINRQCDAVYVVHREDDDSIVFISNMTLNKAICLAIIEANKESNNE